MNVTLATLDGVAVFRVKNDSETFIVSPTTVSNAFLRYMLGNIIVDLENSIDVIDGGLFEDNITIRIRTDPGEPVLVKVRFSGKIIQNHAGTDEVTTYPFLLETKVAPDRPIPPTGIYGYPKLDVWRQGMNDYLESTHQKLDADTSYKEFHRRVNECQMVVKEASLTTVPQDELETDLVILGEIDIPTMVSGAGDSPMLARIRAVNTYGPHPLTVKFYDYSIGYKIETWMLDFGDGSTITCDELQTEITHQYTLPGHYTPVLYIAGRIKSGEECESTYIFPGLIEVESTDFSGDEYIDDVADGIL